MFMAASMYPAEMLAAGVEVVQAALDIGTLRRFGRQPPKDFLPKLARAILVAGILLGQGIEEHAFQALGVQSTDSLGKLGEFRRQLLALALHRQDSLGVTRQDFFFLGCQRRGLLPGGEG